MATGKMHADEVDTDVSLVRRLLAGQFPQWAGLPIEAVDSAGTVNAVYRLGADMAVRLPRIEGGARDVDRERRWLPRLAPLLPVRIPVPIATGTPAEGYPFPWSVHPWLDGENPAVGRVAAPGADLGLLAEDLAAFVRALRVIDPSGGPTAYRHEHLVTRDAETRAAIGQLHGVVDTGAAGEAWDAALRAPRYTGPGVWVHADLSPGNVLVSGGRLSAVIDFGCAGVGEPAVDLIAAWSLLTADARDVFRTVLNVDDATWARGRGWALSIALIELAYYRVTNPVMAATARHVIGEVLASQAAP
ncbi:aminoglycoside phosphotransferase family protein [Streptomyces sp. NPDC000410]|uniref:aminoglycoside phosphotransferase family protein n=1 Tax=Streptomyces sp. NPDC000410 TaxID=3154254 RepID=UPI00332D9E02